MLTARRHDRSSPRHTESTFRRRLASMALAVAIEVLLILAFLGLNNRSQPPRFQGGPTLSIFDVSPEAKSAARASPRVRRTATAAKTPARPAPTPPKLPPRKSDILLLPMSGEELASADIAHLGSNAPDAGGGAGAGDSARVGTAPNGEPLYAAEWYREPTRTEVTGYLPKTMPDGGGSGLVACKTAERFHVEDCVELGSDPPGSRLAAAVRQAAWQFLVRPPRVGGKSLIGTWVRIRIDYLP